MSIIGNIVGVAMGVDLINGKIKLKKKGIGKYIGLLILVILMIACAGAFIFGLIYMNVELILFCGAGTLACVYLLLISPYTQNSNNYYIKVQKSNSFEGFELYYKQRKVELKYDVDKEGKFKWAKNNAKLECVSYSDNSNMNNFTKYRIINYFTTWLLDNDYLSNEVTVSFEKL